MLGSDPVLRPAPGVSTSLSIVVDDATVPAAVDDTASAALLRAGVLATGRSLKYRRPRGAFCLQGDCGTCLMRVDGQPNVRTCTAVVHMGMRLASQNRVLERGPDPTALVDTVFARGMDHHHLMVKPRFMNTIMQEVARNLAGLGTLPDPGGTAVTAQREHHVDALVVGAGPAGAAAAGRLRLAGWSVACVDRLDAAGVRARGGDPLAATGLDTAVFGIYPREHGERGCVAAVQRRADGSTVHTFVPRHVVLATGARDVMIPLRNNDLPGVLAARGLLALLRRTGDRLAVPAVVVGDDAEADALAAALQCDRMAPSQVDAILGGARVEGLACSDGRRDVGVVALAAPVAPVSELARQAGAKVAWNGRGFAIVRGDDGRCGDGPWSTWACGEACGVAAADARADGERIAEAMIAAHGRGHRGSP
ncbi:MAG: (2Fe-2S)-binding protein [Deltaproteobacteria bacterium]|nr:(2Fe-2S)-binding protein [Deltaproteobacteria bacterium]MBK8717764.1 (2Fe-2S)-binding protein [Deltaproteobacteria bacterium]MBP7288815.1 (2Fe-2S)-binding protein [Nannocystaceae bacterium]